MDSDKLTTKADLLYVLYPHGITPEQYRELFPRLALAEELVSKGFKPPKVEREIVTVISQKRPRPSRPAADDAERYEEYFSGNEMGVVRALLGRTMSQFDLVSALGIRKQSVYSAVNSIEKTLKKKPALGLRLERELVPTKDWRKGMPRVFYALKHA